MQEWINQTLESGAFNLAVPVAAFLLGLVSSVATAGCTLPIFAAIVGYSGTQEAKSHRANLFISLCFMLGATIALIILGVVAGFIGQVAQATLGRYWKVFAGAIAIFFGLATLNLLPFKLPSGPSEGKAQPKGLFGAAVFGMVVGGAVSVCSVCCNPGLFIVLGVVILHGCSLWAMTILTAYALGFSLPLAAIVLGVSFGKMMVRVKAADTAIRIVAGFLLIAAGFYFLATV
ncbi:MAG: cytochrome c biogenesis CcdA family protein [Planctomycetota bacterium]